jgi:integrase
MQAFCRVDSIQFVGVTRSLIATGDYLWRAIMQHSFSRRRNGAKRSDVHAHQPKRDPNASSSSDHDVLARYPAGSTPPMRVLEVLIDLYNKQHTAKVKEVSFKTRRERAMFLRRFFRELHERARFPSIPDPRNLGDRHVKAMAEIWQRGKLAAATIQTYFSFLRALANWIGKPGLIKSPAVYGFTAEEYQRHDASNVDKSWSGHQVDIDAVLLEVAQYDAHVGAMLALIRAFGLRKKEAIMFRPFFRVVPFEETRLPIELRKADNYISILAGSKGGRLRYIPIDTPERKAAIAQAQSVVASNDGHMGQPGLTLKQAMRRFDYVMGKFGVTGNALGVTAHGLRHEALIDHFETVTGDSPPVRGGKGVPKDVADLARKEVALLAGHNRRRASNAYLGNIRKAALQTNVADKPDDAKS